MGAAWVQVRPGCRCVWKGSCISANSQSCCLS